MICEIRCGWTDEHLASLPEPPKYDSKLYKPRAFLNNAKIIEINERIIENPELLITEPESAGYICIFMLNRDHDAEPGFE